MRYQLARIRRETPATVFTSNNCRVDLSWYPGGKRDGFIGAACERLRHIRHTGELSRCFCAARSRNPRQTGCAGAPGRNPISQRTSWTDS
jgi:hypothetical protein